MPCLQFRLNVCSETMEKIWKEALVACFKALFQNSCRGMNESTKILSAQPVQRPRNECGTSSVQGRATHCLLSSLSSSPSHFHQLSFRFPLYFSLSLRLHHRRVHSRRKFNILATYLWNKSLNYSDCRILNEKFIYVQIIKESLLLQNSEIRHRNSESSSFCYIAELSLIQILNTCFSKAHFYIVIRYMPKIHQTFEPKQFTLFFFPHNLHRPHRLVSFELMFPIIDIRWLNGIETNSLLKHVIIVSIFT